MDRQGLSLINIIQLGSVPMRFAAEICSSADVA